MPRDYLHDYRSRCIYHITMTKAAGVPAFSRITGTADNPMVERSLLGRIIEGQIWNLRDICPSSKILQYVIMPDHIHFAIFAQERIPKALGAYMAMMKVKCGQIARERELVETVVFDDDFYDRILRRSHKLDTVCNYIRQNPYRLLVRRQNPDFFSRINDMEIDGRLWQAYGNMHLLDNPFKGPVVIHRSDSEAILDAKNRRWMHLAQNGGVLVSPFISKAEKDVRRRCEQANGKIILLSNEPFGQREKPAAHDFDLCAAGRLLILAPMTPLPAGRSTFLFLNRTAEFLSGLRPR